MKVTLLLADAAQSAAGKLYIIGGGWSVIGPDPAPFAIAMKIEVPWDQANQRHQWKLELVTADGEPVRHPNDEVIEVGGDFEVGRPPGLQPGTPIDLPLAISFGPMELEPGRRFEWRLSIDGHHDQDWVLGFNTRRRQT